MHIELLSLLVTPYPRRSVAPLVFSAVILLPIALVLAARDRRRRGQGPTWGELLGRLVPGRAGVDVDASGVPRPPRWGFRRYRFGWPVRRSVDSLHGFLVTETGELVLVTHDRHDQKPYYTLPGGRIEFDDTRPGDVLARALGPAAVRHIEEWSLIHIGRQGKHQDLVFAGLLDGRALEAARDSTRHPLRTVRLTPSDTAHLDLHPHAVAEAIRQVVAAGGHVGALPDLRRTGLFGA